MAQELAREQLIPIGAVLSGPQWPGPVRVAPRGSRRMLVKAVTLDDQSRLLSRLFRLEELAGMEFQVEAGRPDLSGDPQGFRLAAEATRIYLAYTHDPQFAASVARINPLPHQLEAVIDVLHREATLWAAGDRQALAEFLAEGV